MQSRFEVEYPKKPIRCVLTSNKEVSPDTHHPDLIFTHGAGGTLESDAIANFIEGFTSSSDSIILCFQGNINLQSRVKMFKAVIDDPRHEQNSITAVGGRSMGARAAIMAASTDMYHYVLVSYPLHTEKDMRDGILLDLPETANVIFISGDHDNMCQISRLDAVRKKMQCQTWRVIVEGADHGMAVKPKAGTKPVGLKTGEVVAEWLRGKDLDGEHREGRISWNEETSEAEWTGWKKNS